MTESLFKPPFPNPLVTGPDLNPFERGRLHCYQDACENVPFSSTGGPGARKAMFAPNFVAETDRAAYLSGYRSAALQMYGIDWETCEPHWAPAVRVEGRPMQLFELHRDADETGISGVGVVAEGICFSDGSASLRWKTKTTSTAFYSSMADVEAIHGHNGKTRIVWVPR